ncbi:MAG TPA: hypothetical protein VER58_19695 [Thermoanaerobaculia bacterium]|nr:hypothetical protein [Thermoanaerobaculia bacterium]
MKIGVRLLYSKAENVARDPALYWDLLRTTRGTEDPPRLFAIINNAVLFRGVADPDVHRELEAEFASDHLRDVLREHRKKFDFVLLFNRPAHLLNLKLLLGVERPPDGENPFTRFGDLTLHANDYIESPEEMWEGDPGLLGILAEWAPIWELLNPRHMFQLFVRSYLVITEQVPKHPGIIDLFGQQFGTAPSDVSIDGLRMDDYLALVFGLFTAVRDGVLKQRTCIIDIRQFFENTILPHAGIQEFFDRRSGVVATFAAELNLGLGDAGSFKAYVEDGARAMDITVIKQRPILRLQDGRCAILDARFLIELLSTTLYWTLFDRLDKKGRDLFSIFWGECFERFVVRELEFFFRGTTILRTAIGIRDGEIDAIFDYGEFVILIEIKSGLMAKDPRLMRDPQKLRDEIHKKFVDKKGVPQLVKGAKAIVVGEVDGISKDCRIYPILVVDEPVLQCLAANRYVDEQFAAQFDGRPPNVQPLTVMIVDELEELLPYVVAGDIGWEEFLSMRFEEDGVTPDPVHTTLAAIAGKKGIRSRRNDYLSTEGKRIGKLILDRYRFGKTENP